MTYLPDAVADLVLQDDSDQPVAMGSLRPALMVWLRHFGCIFCRQQAAAFAARIEEVEAKGARLVFIGCGSPCFAKTFREDYLAKAPSALVLCDPQRKSYSALGFRRRWLTLLKICTWKRAMAAFRSGFRQSLRPQGDPWQNGGVVVLDGNGAIRYRFVSTDAGHHPPPTEVIDSLGVELMLY